METKQDTSTPSIVTGAELLQQLTPERLAAHEGAYRRGVHQALAFAGDILERATTLKEAKRQLNRAESWAFRLRFVRKTEGRLMLLDFIRGKLATGRGQRQNEPPNRTSRIRLCRRLARTIGPCRIMPMGSPIAAAVSREART